MQIAVGVVVCSSSSSSMSMVLAHGHGARRRPGGPAAADQNENLLDPKDTKTIRIKRYENLLDENPKETYKNLSELKDTET